MDQDLIINAAVESAMATPFKWGTSDCCTFVCDALMALDHPDYMAPLRGTYDDFPSSEVALRNYNKNGLVEAAIKMACDGGLNSVHPFGPSDLGIISSELGPMLALYHRRKWLVRTETGVAYLPITRAVLAWERP